MSIAIGDLVAQIEANLDPLNKSIEEAKRSLDRADKQMSSSMDRFSKSVKQSGEKVKSIGKNVSTYITLPLALAGAASTKFAGDFESSFANVIKTVDATESQFAELRQDFRQMAKEVPTSVNELNRLAGVAGQLGVQAENLTAFTRTIAMLGDTTDIAGEQAALSLSRFMNVMGTAQGDIDRVGSTIVGLGNNFAAMESEIVEIGTSLASFGNQMGLTEAQVLAFATTIAASGGKTEAASTAFQKTAATMQNAVIQGNADLQKFASVAGQSADDFADSFRDNAAGALRDFLQGLNNIQKSGGSTAAVLEDLGLADQRLQREFGKVAGNLGDLDRALAQSTGEWEKNTALTEEAEKRYATFNSRMKVMRNRLYDVGITIGNFLIPIVDKMITAVSSVTDWFGNLTETQQKWMVGVGAAVAALGPLLTGLGFMMTNVVPGLIGQYGLLTKALAGARAAMSVLNTMIATNPIGALITVITAAAGAWFLYNQRANRAKEVTSQLEQVNKQASKAIAKEKVEVNKLVAVIESENATREQKVAALRKLKSINKEYFGDLDEEKIKIEQVKEATDDYIESLMRKARAVAIEEKLVALEKERIDQITSAEKAQERLNQRIQEAGSFGEKATLEGIQKGGEAINKIKFDEYKKERQSLMDLLVEHEKESQKNAEQTTETVVTETEKQVQAVQKGMQQLGNAGLTEGLSIPEPVIDVPDVGDMFGDAEGITAFNKTIDDYNARMRQATLSGELFASNQQVLQEQINATKQAMMLLGEQGFEANHPRIEMMKNQLIQLQGQLNGVKNVTTDWQKISQQAAQQIGDAFLQMAMDGRSATSDIIKQLAAQVIGHLIKQAVANIPPPFNIIAAAGMGAVGGMLMNQIPAFADGGIVSGPQMAMVGEYPGAKSNPEVIAPLDKLQGMIEPRNKNERVLSARVSKGDLLFVLEEARSEHTRKFGDI